MIVSIGTGIDFEGGSEKVKGCIEGESEKVGSYTEKVEGCIDGGFKKVGGNTKGESKKVGGYTKNVDTNSGSKR